MNSARKRESVSYGSLQPQISKTKKPAAPPREKKNRFDYMFTKKTGETLIKAPGSIEGEQFVCEELEDCRVPGARAGARTSAEIAFGKREC